MKRKKRTEILINGSHHLAEELAKEIEKKYEIEMIQEPQHGMVMLKTRETSQKTLFYLGEVLVTECKVGIRNSIGMGIVQGDLPEFAYYLAIIDAAFQEELAETAAWIEKLEKEEKRIQEERGTFYKDVLRTKVSFETMDASS